ncbi:lipoprotein ybbD [Niallia nealsonii AAU1]|nr:lipoprotein ybbD [Niallia nealsonii AAU1]
MPEVENTPSSLVIGNKNDKEYAYRIGRKIGENVKSFGFNLDYAPVLDINSNPENPVIGDRSFGNNADIVHDIGIQVMKGIQAEKVISVVKHFPGHGDTVVDSHIQLPKVNKSLTQLQNLELIPFEYAINNGADVVMVAHILLPKLDKTYPASMSKAVITDLLRNQLHFDGVVITDDMTMGAIVDNFEIGEAAVDSILAGSDIILVAHDYTNIRTVIKSIKTAVENNIITEDRINESVERVMELKNNYLK